MATARFRSTAPGAPYGLLLGVISAFLLAIALIGYILHKTDAQEQAAVAAYLETGITPSR